MSSACRWITIGVRVDALEEALARYRPKLHLPLIPAFQNPTGAVLTAERRRRVLDLALQYRVPIVESDLYGDLYFEQEPAPLAQGPGRRGRRDLPGRRVEARACPASASAGSWRRSPPVAALTVAKTYEDLHTAALTQRLAAAFIGSPHAERHLARLRVGAGSVGTRSSARSASTARGSASACPGARTTSGATLPAPAHDGRATTRRTRARRRREVRHGVQPERRRHRPHPPLLRGAPARPDRGGRPPARDKRSSRSWPGTAPRPRRGSPCPPASSEAGRAALVSARLGCPRGGRAGSPTSARARAPRAPSAGVQRPAAREPRPAAPGSD
mgnify:CR=1 FL=1